MKNNYGLKILLLLLFLNCFFSCASTPEKRIDSVYVMVYDYENSGVMDAVISIDDEILGNTDIYGRLMFPAKDKKKMTHCIQVKKDGYEIVDITTSIYPGQVIYFKIGTGSYYAQKAEKLLDENNANEALIMINKALEIENRKDWSYLKNIITRRLDKWEKEKN